MTRKSHILLLAMSVVMVAGAARAEDAQQNFIVGPAALDPAALADEQSSDTAPAEAVKPETSVPAPDASAQKVETKPLTPEEEISSQLAIVKPQVKVDLIPSLFFSKWEHDLIQDARRGLVTRPPEFADDFAALPEAATPSEPGPRNIVLSGIVFRSSKDWVIWLNNKRVSPIAIPSEILDLEVRKDYIKLEWYDHDTNQIFPIKLRPHQTFNIDTRMFLPG